MYYLNIYNFKINKNLNFLQQFNYLKVKKKN